MNLKNPNKNMALANLSIYYTGDFIGNKITDKITSVGKSKNKEKRKKDETNEVEQIYMLPEKRQQIIDDLRLL